MKKKSFVIFKIPTKKYQISTKLNKVYDLTDRKVNMKTKIKYNFEIIFLKRYCSNECYKSSKYLEAQISNVPVWLRQTPEFLKNDELNDIKFWSSTQRSTKSTKSEHKSPPTETTKQSFAEQKNRQGLMFEIENELKQIEKDWKEKVKIHETIDKKESVLLDNNNYLQQVSAEIDLKERSKQLKKKFIDSIDIHKKPTDFTNLRQIFSFKIEKKDGYIQMGEGSQILQINEKYLTQFYFIEYIIQRIKELITSRTKSYLTQTESSDSLSVNQEREREEHLEACDKLVARKTALFSDIDYSSQTPNFIDKNSDQKDDGEEEMLQKLRGFDDIIKNSNKRKENEINKEQVEVVTDEYDFEAKKPVPDYSKLKEEAIRQQLRIREFFVGKPKSNKEQETTVIDENDTNSEYNQNLIFKIKETDEEIVRVLPTVDSKSQTQIRRKIFYDKLVK